MKQSDKRLEELLLEGVPFERMPSLTDYVKALGIVARPYSGDRALIGMVNSPLIDLQGRKKALFYATAANLIVGKYAAYAAIAYALWH